MIKGVKKMSWAGRLQLGISYLIKLSFAILVVSAALQGNFFISVMAAIMLILSSSAAIIEKNFKVCMPSEWEFLITVFLYLSFSLGELRNYYFKFWWWDLMLHSLSGFLIGLIGFMMVYTIYYTKEVKFPPIYASVFAFSFALSLGVIWEIFEFTVDQLFGFNMQKSGLVDTMWDLIVDSLGALITSVLGYFYLKNGETRIIGPMINRFVKSNPHLFAKLNN